MSVHLGTKWLWARIPLQSHKQLTIFLTENKCHLEQEGFQLLDLLWFEVYAGDILTNSHPEVFLGKVVLKICSKFTGEHPCRSVISIKLQSNFIEIALWHGCSPVNLLLIFRTPFLKNSSEQLFLYPLSYQNQIAS